jgi:hypothetical protein
MFFRQYQLSCLSLFSHLIGHQSTPPGDTAMVVRVRPA